MHRAQSVRVRAERSHAVPGREQKHIITVIASRDKHFFSSCFGIQKKSSVVKDFCRLFDDKFSMGANFRSSHAKEFQGTVSEHNFFTSSVNR
jgi:hypothetical protein